ETGVAVPAERWLDAGERTTPPFFTVRFRTRFFVAEMPRGARLPDVPPSPGEIEEIAFASPRRTLAVWAAGRSSVPPPLLPLLRASAGPPPDTIEELAERVATVNAIEQPNPRIEFVPGIWAVPVRTRTLPPASCTNVWMPGGRRFVVVDPGSADRAEIERVV